MKRTHWVFLWLSLCLLPEAAYAQRSKDWRSAAEQASRLSEEAQALYTTKNFAAALDKYNELYQLSPEPVVLLEIVLCQRQLNLLAEATDSYERFAQESPTFEEINAVQAMISCLKEEQRPKEPLSQPASQPSSQPSTSPSAQPLTLPSSQSTTSPSSALVCSDAFLDGGFLERETQQAQTEKALNTSAQPHNLLSAFGPGEARAALGLELSLLNVGLGVHYTRHQSKRVDSWFQLTGLRLSKKQLGDTLVDPSLPSNIGYLAGVAGARLRLYRGEYLSLAGRAGVAGCVLSGPHYAGGGEAGLALSAHLKKTSLTISGDLSRWQVSDVESPHGQIKLRSLSVSVEHPISRDLNLFGGAQLLLFSNELGSDGLPVLSLGLYR